MRSFQKPLRRRGMEKFYNGRRHTGESKLDLFTYLLINNELPQGAVGRGVEGWGGGG